MNTFSIEELDREEIEFLPPRVVMTLCNTRCYTPPSCYVPSCQEWCSPCDPCKPTLTLRLNLQICI
jgi:hypothetical protein